MTTTQDRIKVVKVLAKECRVDVLDWNDKPGKEFVSFNGDGDMLELLRKEMEADGWYMWPVDEGQEGFFMDFGLQPPPRDYKPPQISAPEISLPSTPYVGTDYRYNGLPDGVFWYALSAAIPIGLCLLLHYSPQFQHMLKLSNEGVGTLLKISLLLILLIVITLFNQPDIYADETKLVVNTVMTFKRPREIAIADIKKVKLYVTKVIIVLKSGKAIEVFIGERRGGELASFIKGKISAK
jgi:hypothetical protein